jgi:hypothetical protein
MFRRTGTLRDPVGTGDDDRVYEAGEEGDDAGRLGSGGGWAWCTCPTDPDQLSLLKEPA